MNKIIHLLFLLLFSSCGSEERQVEIPVEVDSLQMALDNAKSDNKPTVDCVELKEAVKKIEAKYGEQWDFCDCVVKGDSIDKAFKKANLPDKEFNRLSDRFDVIAEKCQAFRIQDANRTPEERAIHEKKVKKCLRAAGVKP